MMWMPLTRLATRFFVPGTESEKKKYKQRDEKRFRRRQNAFSIFFNEDRRRRGRKWTKTMIAMAFRLGSWKTNWAKIQIVTQWHAIHHVQVHAYTFMTWILILCVFFCWLLFYSIFLSNLCNLREVFLPVHSVLATGLNCQDASTMTQGYTNSCMCKKEDDVHQVDT